MACEDDIMSYLKRYFKDNLKRIRQERKFTQRALSEMVDVDLTGYQKWENTERIPRAEQIEKLAQALNVPPYFFFIKPGLEHFEERPSISKSLFLLCKSLGYEAPKLSRSYINKEFRNDPETGRKLALLDKIPIDIVEMTAKLPHFHILRAFLQGALNIPSASDRADNEGTKKPA